MTESISTNELFTFMCDPEKDKVIRLRATMKGKTKSALYRQIIKNYLNS